MTICSLRLQLSYKVKNDQPLSKIKDDKTGISSLLIYQHHSETGEDFIFKFDDLSLTNESQLVLSNLRIEKMQILFLVPSVMTF